MVKFHNFVGYKGQSIFGSGYLVSDRCIILQATMQNKPPYDHQVMRLSHSLPLPFFCLRINVVIQLQTHKFDYHKYSIY